MREVEKTGKRGGGNGQMGVRDNERESKEGGEKLIRRRWKECGGEREGSFV